MAKRELEEDANGDAQGGDTSSESGSIVDVDIEFFDPDSEIDFHGLKALLRQLLDADGAIFDLSELASIILAQPHVGTMVKTEGKGGDPYGFITCLNLEEHGKVPVIQELKKYILSKSSDAISAQLQETDFAGVGLALTERVVNMPLEIVPPLFAMLFEELRDAVNDKKPFEFTHYLFISKSYKEMASSLHTGDESGKKRRKTNNGEETMLFHQEDAALQQYAKGSCVFDYTKESEVSSDSKRVFQELGIRPQGSLLLLEAAKFEDAVKAIYKLFGADTTQLPPV